MTIDRMNLKALVERGSDEHVLREITAYIANFTMDLEVKSLTGAAHGERSPASINPIATATASRAWDTDGTRSICRSQAQERQQFPSLLARMTELGAQAGQPLEAWACFHAAAAIWFLIFGLGELSHADAVRAFHIRYYISNNGHP